MTRSFGIERGHMCDGILVVQERNSANTPSVTYTRGNDLSGTLQGAGGWSSQLLTVRCPEMNDHFAKLSGGMLARSQGYSSGSWTTHHFYHVDGNGNITYLVNSSQTLGASYKYNPFGGTISSSGTYASANRYRFSSKEVNVSNGTYYYGYRWYHSNLQRWLNRDPLGEQSGINLYCFVRNKPTYKIDRLGREMVGSPEGSDFFNGPISCATKIKTEVWDKYGWDNEGNPTPNHIPGDNHFRYGHCVAHCRISRECGSKLISWLGGIGKEIEDQFKYWFGGGGDGFDPGDLDANKQGRKNATDCPEKSCEEACKGSEG